MVPLWVLEKHKPVTVDMAGEGDVAAYGKTVIHTAVPWDAGLQAEYLRFVEEFGKTGLARHPALLGLYVHGISTSLGEELWFNEKAFENLEKAGMTPDKLRDAFSVRIKAWAKAFGDRAGKLAWVGVGWIPAPDEEWEAYKKVQTDLNRLAVDQGLGYRGGGIERYNQISDAAGQRVDDGGFFVNDPGHPILAEARYYGDENEIYDPKNKNAAYMYRASTLRALQMGMRFLWVGDEGVSLDPAVSQYFNLTAGKTLAESPDAWCYLRETQVRKGSQKIIIKNFERGLMQRSTQAWEATPALFTGPLKDFGDEASSGEWAARTVQGQIGFNLDREFWSDKGPADVTCKVTYVDTGAVWHAGYSTSEGVLGSEPVTETGDGGTKTATLVLKGFQPANHLMHGFDFELQTLKGEFIVMFVRLIR